MLLMIRLLFVLNIDLCTNSSLSVLIFFFLIRAFNRGVCVCERESLSFVWLFMTPWTVACQASTPTSLHKTLEWVAMPSSRGSSRPRDWTQVSYTAGRFFTVWASREAFVNHQKTNSRIQIMVLSSLLQLFSRRFSLILVNTLQPLEKPDFAPVIPISDEHQVLVLFLFLFIIFSMDSEDKGWETPLYTTKFLLTQPYNAFLSAFFPGKLLLIVSQLIYGTPFKAESLVIFQYFRRYHYLLCVCMHAQVASVMPYSLQPYGL